MNNEFRYRSKLGGIVSLSTIVVFVVVFLQQFLEFTKFMDVPLSVKVINYLKKDSISIGD